jgi:uncharacterized protein
VSRLQKEMDNQMVVDSRFSLVTRRSSMWLGLLFVVVLLRSDAQGQPAKQKSASQENATQRNFVLAEHYDKAEHQIAMRDGVKLFLVVYAPKDQSTKYPIMLNRTPYSCQPYGADEFSGRIGPSPAMEREKYIFVKQDVRGRWMSEGTYDNMRPHVWGDSAIDESSDTYDTIEWLIKNVPNNNGKVGMWGISYPGFYAAAALPEAHPALVAASPQAPIGDFYFDDFHHNGAFTMAYFIATATFGYQHHGPTKIEWYNPIYPDSNDSYDFLLKMGGLSNAKTYYGTDNFFWQEIIQHPNYDEFWQKRSIIPHMKDVHTNVLTVGGFFDAEDLYGPLKIYQSLEKNNPKIFNALVMGPWSHGDWARGKGKQVIGDIYFGDDLSTDYQNQVEAPFFAHFLKGKGDQPNFEARIFDTGVKAWFEFKNWPPADGVKTTFYARDRGRLQTKQPEPGESAFTEYLSDPNKPVPHTQEISMPFTPRAYMTEDQRFAARRPDVLTFETELIEDDMTLAGDIDVTLFVSTTGTDGDWIVKLIDVYPNNEPNHETTPRHVRLGGYQQMVRSEVVRARFREGHDKSIPMKANEVTELKLPLQDVFHTFQPGHRMMIQVQSTWFPLVDRNPQQFVPNIYEAKTEDFIKATQRVYHSPDHATRIEVKLLPNAEEKN